MSLLCWTNMNQIKKIKKNEINHQKTKNDLEEEIKIIEFKKLILDTQTP